MRSVAVILLFLGLFIHCQAQNLVLNPGFEEREFCPSNYNQETLRVIKKWSQLNEGTPDYFNSCAQKVGIPDNMFGSQMAHGGEAYAGMAIYSPNKRNYREYLSSKLSRPLNAGEMVCVEMYVSPADYCMYVTDGIGILISKNKPTQDRMYLANLPATIQNPRLNMLDETDGWLLISDIYTAQGGEEYITIGNFQPDKYMKVLHRTKELGAKDNNTWAYVFIDDVSVTPVKSKAECSCENEVLASMVHDPPLELSEYDHIKLDAILFDFDQDVLTAEAIKQLEEIFKLLRKNKSMYMAISGHTDIVGPDGYNMDLSKRRADKVIQYLVSKGIAQERLTVEYDGSKLPVADNATPEGRALNRRVEFSIRKKRYELIQ